MGVREQRPPTAVTAPPGPLAQLDLEPTNIHPRNTSDGATKCVNQPEHVRGRAPRALGHLRGLRARNVSRGAAGPASVPKCSEAVLAGSGWKEHEDLGVQENKCKRRRGEDLVRKAVREERGKVGPTKKRETRRGVERETVRAGGTSARSEGGAAGRAGAGARQRGGAGPPWPPAGPRRGARDAASPLPAQRAVTYQPGGPRAAE